MLRIGIDLGGTKTEGIVMDANGAILVRERRPTPQAEGYDAVLVTVRDLVRDLERRAATACSVGRSRHPASRAVHGSTNAAEGRKPEAADTSASLRVGIGTPGALSMKAGCLKNSNTVCLNGRPVKQDLERLLGREIRLANDANCFALSEAVDGAGAGYGVVFGVILGTGVGGGIVVHGRLLEGAQHIAGEWGHNMLEADGPPCYCGKRGCVETLLSGPGLARDYAAQGRANAGRSQHPASRDTRPSLDIASGDASLDARAIVERAAQGDPRAEAAMQRYLARFGHALSVVVNILDPDVIVLGGGMSNIARLYTEGRAQLARHTFNDELRTVLRPHVHGDSSGVRGAARLWPAAAG